MGELWESPGGLLPSPERPCCLCELVRLCSPPRITRKVAPSSLFHFHSIHPQLGCKRGSRPAKGGLCLHFVFLCTFSLLPAQPPRRPSPLPTEPAYLLLSGACFLSPQPASLNVVRLVPLGRRECRERRVEGEKGHAESGSLGIPA